MTDPSYIAQSEKPTLGYFSQRFEDEELEAIYVQTCVQPNIQKCRQRGAFCLMLFGVYWLLAIHKMYDIVEGLAGDHKPLQVFILVTLGGIGLGLVGVLPWPGLLKGEIPTILWLLPAPFLACFSSRFYIAKMTSEDPWVSWGLVGFCFTNSTILLMLDSIVTVVCLFFQMRSCMIWPVVLISPTIYVANWYFHGSPHSSEVEASHILLLVMLSGFSFLGRRQMERQERQQFFRVHKLGANVSDLRENLLQLEARLNAMQALMGTVCEVVFRAGENLRVVGCNTRLEELLGTMQGRALGEKIVDEHIQERFQRVVSPLLAAPLRSQNKMMEEEGSQGQGVVLVPPVSFQGQACLGAGDSTEKSSNFDAEILVADTGMWHGTGTDAWRYLVGLKGLVHQSSSLPLARLPNLPSAPQPAEAANALSPRFEEQLSAVATHRRGHTTSHKSHSSRSSRSSKSSPTPHNLMTINEESHNFEPTPIATISVGLLELLEHWHLGVGTSLKTVLNDAVDFLEENSNLQQDSLQQGMRPFIAGQCRNCKILYSNGLSACEMCGTDLNQRVKLTSATGRENGSIKSRPSSKERDEKNSSGSSDVGRIDSFIGNPDLTGRGDSSSDTDRKGNCIAVHKEADNNYCWRGGRMYAL